MLSNRGGPQPPARTPAGDAFSALVVKIFQLHGHLTAVGDALAAPAGQSSARWQVLAAVEDAPRSVADIARVLGLARQSVQRVADLLERDHLAVYAENPVHQRAKLLELTAEGREALGKIATAQCKWADRHGQALGLANLERATAVLTRMLESVARDEEPEAPDLARARSRRERPSSERGAARAAPRRAR